MTWEYAASIVRVLDGDTAVFRLVKTFTQEVDFGFFIHDSVALSKSTELSFRFFGINCPEIHSSDAALKARGLKAKAEVERLCSLGPLRLVSYKPDKYGRWLADVYVTPSGKKEIHINQALLDGGFALPYNGDGVKPV
jgi:endonuclease YncB( thermonuclease family)